MKNNGYVALEVDTFNREPRIGPILGWDLERENAMIEGLSNYNGPFEKRVKTFPWYGASNPTKRTLWEYHEQTKTVIEGYKHES